MAQLAGIFSAKNEAYWQLHSICRCYGRMELIGKREELLKRFAELAFGLLDLVACVRKRYSPNGSV